MAATAHSDPYSIFMRKIGYSVGLEHTLERFGDLQELYVSRGDITLASWNELVTGEIGWKLKTDKKLKTGNIADVFFSLGLVHRTPGDLLVLENLDAAAIAASLLNEEKEKLTARSVVFLWAVLVNDGEIFMNLLLAGFEEGPIREKLSAMIAYKRKRLTKAMPGKNIMKRIARVVTIERQEKNKGSTGVGHSVASLKRTEPLQTDRSLASEPSSMGAVEFSPDYFRKVPPRRKDWARTLGLWSDDAGLTTQGHDFIDMLRSAGYIGDGDFFTFWPMEYELICSGFKPNLFEETKTLWETLIDFTNAYTGVRVKPFERSDTDTLVDQLDSMIKVYRSLHTRKSMLRRELPITVAYLASVAMASAKKDLVIDFPKALSVEQKGKQRRITFRRSRNIGGALSLKC